MTTKKVLIVGAGLAGAVCAEQLSSAGHSVLVIDQRSHVGGNCHTERDPSTGIMEHKYGPHIFNTSIPEVWKYVNKFGNWIPYVNRVKALAPSGIYSMPINLHTINQFFHFAFSPEQAKAFIAGLSERQYENSEDFEGRAKFLLGTALYQEFFYSYTKKQWGCEPRELPASILKRLPIRFNYDDNYYSSTWQAMPQGGYTEVIRNMLGTVPVLTGVSWNSSLNSQFDHVIFTGPIDEYYSHMYGRLGYRTVRWTKCFGSGDLQGTAVINHCSSQEEFTRTHEHKHFAPWEEHSRSILLTEFSKETEPGDIPFYPKRLPDDLAKLDRYASRAKHEQNVTFCGRLGTYSYMNMDLVINQALETSNALCRKFA